MALKTILIAPDPRLKKKSKPVDTVDAETRQLMDDMLETMYAAPGIGLIFLVPGITETLRVNGTARITTEAALLAPLAAQGKVPATGLVVSVREAFFHCGKAVMRARLWDPASQVPRATFPSLGRVLAEQTGAIAVAEAERAVEESYRTRLY